MSWRDAQEAHRSFARVGQVKAMTATLLFSFVSATLFETSTPTMRFVSAASVGSRLQLTTTSTDAPAASDPLIVTPQAGSPPAVDGDGPPGGGKLVVSVEEV